MTHTFRQIFQSGKFLAGFSVFASILLIVIIYPLIVTDRPLAIIAQGTFFPPGIYANVYDSIVSTHYTLNLDNAAAKRIARLRSGILTPIVPNKTGVVSSSAGQSRAPGARPGAELPRSPVVTAVWIESAVGPLTRHKTPRDRHALRRVRSLPHGHKAGDAIAGVTGAATLAVQDRRRSVRRCRRSRAARRPSPGS